MKWTNQVAVRRSRELNFLSLFTFRVTLFLSFCCLPLKLRGNRPFATSDQVVQNPPCWRASSLLFPHWEIKTKRPEPVKLDLPLF